MILFDRLVVRILKNRKSTFEQRIQLLNRENVCLSTQNHNFWQMMCCGELFSCFRQTDDPVINKTKSDTKTNTPEIVLNNNETELKEKKRKGNQGTTGGAIDTNRDSVMSHATLVSLNLEDVFEDGRVADSSGSQNRFAATKFSTDNLPEFLSEKRE